MTELVPSLLVALLVTSSVFALLVRRLLWSSILLFYSSLLLGGILFWYGAVYAGLFHIITFAGAVSVMFMVIIMIVGQDQPEKIRLSPQLVAGLAVSAAVLATLLMLTKRVTRVSNAVQESSLVSPSIDDLAFLWNYQSWALVFILVPVTIAILTIVNLFSREGEAE